MTGGFRGEAWDRGLLELFHRGLVTIELASAEAAQLAVRWLAASEGVAEPAPFDDIRRLVSTPAGSGPVHAALGAVIDCDGEWRELAEAVVAHARTDGLIPDLGDRAAEILVILTAATAYSAWLAADAPAPADTGVALELAPLNTVGEVARFVKVSDKTVLRAIAAGDLQALRFGSSWRIQESAVWAWLES